MPNLIDISRNQHRTQKGRMAVSWAFALLLAWLLSLIVAKPVAAQAEITPSSPCFASTNLTNLSAGGTRGITNQPVISGNGARVSFWSVNNLGGGNVDGNIEVFVRETGSNSVVQLTDSVGSILGGFNLEPSINTAGNRIAFYSDRDLVDGQNGDGNFEIFLALRANNGTWSITQITHTQGSANLFPSINSAGDRITFVSDDSELHNIDESRVNADRNFEIFLVTIPNSGEPQFRQITNTGAGVTNDQPVINAAGNRIAFTAATGQTAQVFVWDESQSAPAQLTQTDTNDQPSISADGTSIVYIATTMDDRSRVVLHTLSADGSESRAEVIVPSATNTKYRGPSISGNGGRVVYVAEQGTGSAIQINVLLYDVNTGLGVPISEVGGGTGEQPAISSDGTRVTFVGVQAVGGSTDNAGSDIYLNECPQGDLVLEFVTPPPTTVLAGIDVVYQFRVTNNGPSVADNAFVRSDLGALPGLPANVAFLLPPGCSTDANDILVCQLGDIGVSASRVFTFGYDIPSNAGLTDIVSQIEVGANIVDPNPADNVTAQFKTRIFEEAALSLQVTTDRSTILAGSPEQLTYDLIVTNAGPSQARSARITDTLPTGSSFVSVQLVQGGGSSPTCSPPVGRIVACNLGNLTSGSVTIVRIKVTANASAPATLINVATVRSLTQETNLANNTATTQTAVEQSADMTITKSAFPTDTVIAGTEITYTLSFTNNGFADTLNAVVVDVLPQDVTYARSVLPLGASCTPSGGGEIVTCNFPGNLLVGESRTFDIVALVGSVVPAGPITNTATVSSGRSDPTPANNVTPPVQNEVTLLADLVVSKTVNTTTPDVLEIFTYTVKLRNDGPSQAYNVVVTDLLPSELTFVSATASVGSYNETSGLWTVGTLPVAAVGNEETLNIRVSALASAGGDNKVNTATAGSSIPEPDADLPSSDSVAVTPQLADVQVTKTSSPTSAAHVIAGEQLVYTLRLENNGPTLARSVQLTDVLPANVFLVSVTEPGGRDQCVEGPTITCNVGNMADNAVLNYTVVVTRELKGLITNTVSVGSPTPDLDLGNNDDIHSILVDPDVPDHLVFTVQPPIIETAGATFDPAPVVEIRDRFDNLVDVGSRSNDQIRLRSFVDSTCTTGVSLPDPINNNTVTASGGVATFSLLNYTRSESIYLRAADIDSESAGVDTDCSNAVTINPDSTRQVVITSDPQTVVAGHISDEITVTRKDQFGNDTFEDNFVLSLVSTSPTGDFLDEDNNPISTVTILDTLASADFFYTDTDDGTHDITVSDLGIISDTQPITIVAGPASALLVVVSAPPTVTAGVRSGEITIARIDEFGNENSSDPDLFVTLESNSPNPADYAFYDDDGTTVITTTDIVSGTSRATFSYLDERAGDRTLEFNDQNVGIGALDGATLTITVVPAATHHLVFSTTAQTITAGETSATIQVAREDEFNNRNFADAALIVDLDSSSTGAPDFIPNSPVTILQGSDHVNFQYSDTLAGTFDLTASSGVLVDATQEITVIAAAADNLVVLTDPQTIIAGAPSGEIRIQRRDQFGNPAPNGGTLTVDLDTTSASGEFVPLASLSPIDFVQITGTATDASFRYTDTVQGVYVMTFDGSGTFLTTQTITVTPGAATQLVFTQNPGTAIAGANSGFFVVERRDQFNNTHSGPTTVVVNLATNSTGPDPFFINGAGVPDVTSVQIPSGSPTTTFRYNDTRAGTWQLTASATDLMSDMANITIVPDDANQLAFISLPIVETAGVTSTLLTLQQQDQYGNEVIQTVTALDVDLTTSAPSPPARFVNAADTAAITEVSIAVGNSEVDFRYYDEKAGTPTLTATASALPSPQVQQQATIVAAVTKQVKFISPPRTITAGVPSLPITVERQDEFDNPNNSDPPLMLTLAATSTGTYEFRNAAGTTQLPGGNQLTISLTFSRTSFSYYDELRDVPQLSVASSLITITGDTQSQTVLGAAAVRLQIIGDSAQDAGDAQQLSLFAFDTFGNLSDPYTGARSLRFGGANDALDGTSPTVTNNVPSPIDFGTNTAITFNAGVASAGGLMTLYRAETATITATDVVANIHAVGADALPVTVSANTRTQVRAETVSGGGGQVVPSQTITAGQAITLYAISRDDYNNFVGNAADANWVITPTGGVTSGDIDPTISSNFTQFSPQQPGTAIIAPEVGGLATTPSGLIQVQPSVPHTISVELTPDGSGGLVTASTITAGTSITVYAVTRDIFGNYIGNVTANWAMINTTGGVNTSANLSFTTNSTYTVFTGRVIGTGRIRATKLGVPNNQPSGVLTVVPANASRLLLAYTTPATGMTAGNLRRVAISAYDPFDNQATSYTGDKNLIFTGPMSSTRPVTPPTIVDRFNISRTMGTPTTFAFLNGQAQTSGIIGNIAFYHVQTGSLTATDGTISSNAANFSVTTAAAMDKISLDAQTTTLIAGVPVSLTMRAEDAYGNLKTNYDNDGSTTMPLIFQGTPSPVIGAFNPTVRRHQNLAGPDDIAFGGTTTIRFIDGIAQVNASNFNGMMTIYKTGVFVITADDNSTGLEEDKPAGALTVTVNNSLSQVLELDLVSPQTNGAAFGGGVNRVRYVDTFGNPVTARPVTLATSLVGTIAIGGSTNNDHLLDEANDFDSSGIANFNNSSPTNLTFTYTGLPGSGVFTATAPNPLGGTLVDTATVNIVPGPPVSARVLGRVGAGPFINNHTISAGQPISLEIRLFDASGNLATNYDDLTDLLFTLDPQPGVGITPTVSESPSGNVNLDIPRLASIDFNGGVSTVTAGNNGLLTLYAQGGYQLRVSSTGAITVNTESGHHLAVTVNPGPFAELFWDVDGDQASGVVFDNGTLTARDAFANTLLNFTSLGHSVEIAQTSNPTGTVTVTGGGDTLAPGDFSSGVANLSGLNFTYTGLEGLINFEATAVSAGVTGDTDVNIVPGPPALAHIQGYTATGTLESSLIVTANHPISLSIRLFDSAHNVAHNFDGSLPLDFALTTDPTAVITDNVGIPHALSELVDITFIDGVSTVTNGENGLLTINDPPGTYTLSLSKGAPNAIATESGHELEIAVQPDLGGASIGGPQIDEGELLNLAAVGDTVWLDENGNGIQDSGEVGIEGVQVELFTVEGASVAVDTTDAYGKYLISGLKPGDYYAEFVAPPGYVFTAANSSGQAAVDSNASVPEIRVSVTVANDEWNYTFLVPWVGSGGERAGSEGVAGDAPDEKVSYTISYTNTDTLRNASNVVIFTTLPAGTMLVADESSPGWRCTDDAAGESCSLALSEVPANSTASRTLVLQRKAASEPPNLVVGVTQSTAAQSELITLGLAETNLMVDAGLIRMEVNVPDGTPTTPSDDEQAQGRSIFLPTVRTQE